MKKVEIISKNNGFTRFKVGECILEGQYSRQSVVDDYGSELRFRPEDCFWRDDEEENTIPVTVVMSTFEGGVYRVKVETDDRESFCVLHPRFFSAGRHGFIRISRERLYIYE